jgi:periplasmic protein CpxP/Spy
MLKKLVLLPVLAFSFTLAQPLFAKEVTSPAQESTASTCICKHTNKMTKALNLDDNQLAQIKTIKAKAREEVKTNIQKLRAIRVQIRGLIFSKKVDEKQLNNLISQKTAILTAIMKTRVISKNQIYNSLNPKQQLAFQQMMKNGGKDTRKKCACIGHSS